LVKGEIIMTISAIDLIAEINFSYNKKRAGYTVVVFL
jgi:hypothetical protein